MRVIAGSARRLLLKTVEGMDTRPTTDRIKETLFNMIQNDLYGRSFLDLFAGSGAIGIEALSRGASEAVFIDNGIRQVSCIRDNLKTTKLESGAKVLNCGVLEGLSRLGRDHGAFDFIFMDPPYGCDLERQVLEALQDSPLAEDRPAEQGDRSGYRYRISDHQFKICVSELQLCQGGGGLRR